MTLEEARKIAGLSRAELARRAGVSDDDLYDLENARNQRPAWELVGRITGALREAGLKGLTPEDLFPLRSTVQEGA